MDKPQERFIREPECKEITGLSKTTRWRMEKAGEFPTRERIGSRICAWRLSEINAWMEGNYSQ